MTFLRRVLKVQAAFWAINGVAFILAPALVLRSLDQRVPAEGAWLRMTGVMAIVLALLMVLVAQHVQEVWWWAWAFAVLEAGIATISILNALVGLQADVAAWPWWLSGFASIAFGALDLIGIARAGQERPIV
jgi:hypothetical protein